MPKPRHIDVLDPATGKLLGRVEAQGKDEVERAVEKAREAFSGWRRTPLEERAAALERLASLIAGEKDDLGRVLSRETGKPLAQAVSETANCAELLSYFAEEGLRIHGEAPRSGRPKERVLIDLEPVGVVAAITPFNYPLSTLACKLGPALAAGCTVVAKPDEQTPFSTLEVLSLARDAGIAEGVFQVVTGLGEATGRALTDAKGVDLVAFTGSRETGKSIMAGAAGSIKRLVLELGGQCPALVLEGAPWQENLAGIVRQCFNNSGQYCYRINRIFVEKGEYGPFVEALADAARGLVVGPPEGDRVDLGPLRNMNILKKSQLHVKDALDKGAELVTGGKRLRGGDLDRGIFYPPTVLAGARPQMLVMREETFGPVVGVMEVKDAGEAVRLADATPYGLAAYIFSGDPALGLALAEELTAGSVWVNKIHQAYHFAPFGGMRESGLGREKSRWGLMEYLEPKTIYFHY